MITIKDIQSRIAEVLTENGFNVVASEVDEGFKKPAVFVSVFPSSTELLPSGGLTEQETDSVEIKYISAAETVEDCVNAAVRMKELFLYHTLDIKDRRITIQRIEFETEKNVLYTYFDVSFIQARDINDDYDSMQELYLTGGI